VQIRSRKEDAVHEDASLAGTFSVDSLLATVLGAAEQGAAIVVIRSTRNDARCMAPVSMSDGSMSDGSMSDGRLQWCRIGMVASGSDDEPFIIPERVVLGRSDVGAKQNHVAKIAESGCRWPD
jgi:hypothetical protein